MELPTYRENIADMSARKMISPESQIGKVYQKTNVPLHQRSNR